MTSHSSVCSKALLVFFFLVAGQAQTIELGMGVEQLPLNLDVRYFEDPTAKLTLDLVREHHEEGRFLGGQTKTLSFGFTQSAYWFHISLTNKTTKQEDWILEVQYPVIDFVDCYLVYEDGTVLHAQAGDSIPFLSRAKPHHNLNFALHLPIKQTVDVFIRGQTSGAIQMPLVVWDEDSFDQYSHNGQIIFGFYYGLLFAMLVYNLLIFVSIRDVNYLYYVAYIMCYGLFQFSLNGLSFEYLWPDSPWWNNRSIGTLMGVGMFFIGAFSRSFLQMKIHTPKAEKLIVMLMLYNLFLGPLALLLPYKYIIPMVTFGILIQVGLIFYSGVSCWLKNFKPAKFFMLSWVALLTGMVLYVLKTFGLVPASFITEYAIQIGSALEVLLLSFALADRMRLLAEENESIQTEVNQRLQEKVSQRTQALEAKTQEALQARVEAEKASNAKGEFLATMSHEIRTPMNGVLGMIELLKTSPLNHDQLGYVRTIHNSGQALLRVINDILDYSKIESGKLDVERIAYNLQEVIDDCISIFSTISAEKSLGLYAVVSPDVPEIVMGDPVRLKQVLINYLSNAFKFTEQGEIIVYVSLESDSASMRKIRFDVKDTGVGIAQDKLSKLFDKFSQADSSITRKYGGTGLGLAICRRLSGLMGGETGLSSVEGKGSTFWFSVVLDLDGVTGSESCRYQFSSLEGYRLLIVDHDQVFVDTTKLLIEKWGASVITASTMAEAQQSIAEAEDKFNWIMLEETLLEEDKEAELKNWKDGNTHIVLTRVSGGQSYAGREVDKGVSRVLEKPLTHLRLRKILVELLGLHFTHGCSGKVCEPQWNFSELSLLIAEDNPVNQMVISGFMKKLNVAFELVGDGLIAVNTFKNNSGKYHLVLMDCEMPNLDGYEATKQIRQYELEMGLKRTPLVALSAHALKEFEEVGRRSGMDGFLTKPINKDEIIALLKDIDQQR